MRDRYIYILTNYKFINTALINIITIDRIMSFYRERGKNEFVPRDFGRPQEINLKNLCV